MSNLLPGNADHVLTQRGRQGLRIPHPLKNHNNIGFLSNAGPDPL